MIKITVDDSGMQRATAKILKKLATPEPALKEIGLDMMLSINKNFETQGRPQRWTDLSEATKAARRNKNKSKILILQDTGRLRSSIGYQIINEGQGVAVGTNVEYGRYHQFGANLPAMTITPKRAKALRFMVGGKVVYAKRANIPARKLPQRQFLLFQDEDISNIHRTLISHYMDEIL